jgi:hypothetical protein
LESSDALLGKLKILEFYGITHSFLPRKTMSYTTELNVFCDGRKKKKPAICWLFGLPLGLEPRTL